MTARADDRAHESVAAPTAQRTLPFEGFQLAYERSGAGHPVVALHGWPGDRGDWRGVAEELDGQVDLIAVDLRGFGESDAPLIDPQEGYSPLAQARSVVALIEQLQLGPVVLAGVDLGSMVAEQVARLQPDGVSALVRAPPVPGLSARLAEPASIRERWYIAFHQTELAAQLLDGRPAAIAGYLAHFWSHWSGPDFVLDGLERDRLVDAYSAPGRFAASTAVYRSGRPAVGAAPLATPTTVLWPERDPLFPAEWASDLGEHLPHAHVVKLPGVGHFVSREAPAAFAAEILRRVG